MSIPFHILHKNGATYCVVTYWRLVVHNKLLSYFFIKECIKIESSHQYKQTNSADVIKTCSNRLLYKLNIIIIKYKKNTDKDSFKFYCILLILVLTYVQAAHIFYSVYFSAGKS